MDRRNSGAEASVNQKLSVRARDVACPHCTAAQGKPCVDGELRHMRHFHARRVRVAQKQVAA